MQETLSPYGIHLNYKTSCRSRSYDNRSGGIGHENQDGELDPDCPGSGNPW